jgi:transcriptional regulator with XRE-family HTH domain
MEGNENYGVILKHLREKMNMSVRKFSKKINRSIGWISEIENGTGTARLTSAEFDSLVELLDAGKWRGQFRTWVANYKNAERVDRTFEGAILKHVRVKKGIRLEDALTERHSCWAIFMKKQKEFCFENARRITRKEVETFRKAIEKKNGGCLRS